MNYLAHLLLSGPDADLRVGGFLGDFVRGRLTGERPVMIERGIALHRHVDAASARAAPVHDANALFPQGLRRWAPIALDVLFDHYLARDFDRYGPGEPLNAFAAACYRQLDARRMHLPDPAERFLDRMIEADLLGAYADRSSVDRALAHLSRRARRPNPLADMGGALVRLDDALYLTFSRLMPLLESDCLALRAATTE